MEFSIRLHKMGKLSHKSQELRITLKLEDVIFFCFARKNATLRTE